MNATTHATGSGTGRTPEQTNLAAIKSRQHSAWSSGDYAVVGTTLQIVGEELCEALDVRSGQRVLDVAAGNGNVSLAAARRWCEVVSTDYVPALLEWGRERAAAERLAIEFREADAETVPLNHLEELAMAVNLRTTDVNGRLWGARACDWAIGGQKLTSEKAKAIAIGRAA